MSKSFLRKGLAGFKPYVPGEQPPDGEGWVKLNTNESPLPPSPKVIAAIKAATDESLRLYPSPTAAPAREAIAKHFHLDVAHPPSHRASSRGYPPRRTVVIGLLLYLPGSTDGRLPTAFFGPCLAHG